MKYWNNLDPKLPLPAQKEGKLDTIKRGFEALPPFINKLFDSLAFWERMILLVLLMVFLGSLSWNLVRTYYRTTISVPAYGGTYVEGIVGKPEYLNPVLSENNNTDADLTSLIYSGLMRHDGEQNLINDVASGWQLSEDKMQYTISLREDAAFHDGTPLTADDVLFTINMIQNPRYKSPLLPNWVNVDVRAEGRYQVVFTLKKPFVPFLHNLTFGILPKHIWENVTPEEFPLSEYNKKPVGSGPYAFVRLEKDSGGTITQVVLKANNKYYTKRPYIETLLFKFYPNEQAAIDALNKQEVAGINNISHQNASAVNANSNTMEILQSRYFAVFLNINHSKIIADDSVREALAWTTCKKQIIDEALHGKGKEIDGPVLTVPMEGVEGFEARACSVDKGKEILEKGGWKLKDYKDKNKKEESSEDEEAQAVAEPRKVYQNASKDFLTLTLTTADYPELVATAEILKGQWESLGAVVNVEVLSIGDLTNTKIDPRDYDALLFGEILGADPDPRPYWHSAERKSPGQNLASYNNVEADELLDRSRAEVNEEVRSELFQKFQLMINRDVPAIFLYSPSYLYPINKGIRGVDIKTINTPAERLAEITNWFTIERRAAKD